MPGHNFEGAIISGYSAALDFAYTGLQLLFTYNYTGKMVEGCAWFKEHDYMISYEVASFFTSAAQGFELFASLTFDEYVKDKLVFFDVSDDTVRRYLASLDPTLFMIYHPEYGFYGRSGHKYYINNQSGDLQLMLVDFLNEYSLIGPINFLMQLWTSIYFMFVFFALFFSFFSAANNEEGAADAEFALNNISVEAEKELFAAEDAKFLVIMFVGFFGMYFAFLSVAIHPTAGITAMLGGLLPVLIGCIICIPISLLFDFGVLFLLYLRGASNTSSFFFELAYDYIGITAFFTRLVVQFVRMVLMFVVYCMMHDTVVLQKVAHWFVPVGESFYDEILAIRFTSNSISYFLLITFPCRLAYWTYEVMHTFFVVTAQFAAFFTIAFWLFLLFYTFFVYEKFEYHFKSLRATKRIMREELAELKKKNK